MRQDPQVRRDLVDRGGNPTESVGQIGIDFPGIRLACDRISPRESDFLGDPAFKLPNFFMVPVEQLKKARLGPGRPLGTAGQQTR